MMDVRQKPFACTINGCEMTFTNEDHLNWHRKKHEMMLNLGLTYRNTENADQTPTPTRFIRNCEEVGLFQDLQNVNPFDETFKKAVESGKTGTLHVPQQTNDDTLHTPHIFPPVDTNQTEKFTNHQTDVNPPNEFCFVSVPTIELTDNDNDFDDNDQMNDLIIDTSGSDNEIENNSTNIPQQCVNDKEKTNNSVVQIEKPRAKKSVKSTQNYKEKTCENSKELEKLRAMNRAAQSRCRRKKQQIQKKMEDELRRFKHENNDLIIENQVFKYKFAALTDLIIKTRDNGTVKDPDLLNEVERILNSVVGLQNNVPISPKNQTEMCNSTTTIPIVQQQQQQQPIVTKPVLIQVVGPVEQLAVSVVTK